MDSCRPRVQRPGGLIKDVRERLCICSAVRLRLVPVVWCFGWMALMPLCLLANLMRPKIQNVIGQLAG